MVRKIIITCATTASVHTPTMLPNVRLHNTVLSERGELPFALD